MISSNKNLALLVLVTVSFSSGCKKKSYSASYQGFVMGDDDMVVANAAGAQEAYKSGIMATGSIVSQDLDSRKIHYCTGSVIAPAEGQINPRVISNAHCFTESSDPAKPLTSWACHNTKIVLGITKANLASYHIGSCKKDTLRVDAQADISIFELTEPLPASIIPFTISLDVKSPGTKALVIHHPVVEDNMVTPTGTNLKVPVSIITSENCAIAEKEYMDRGAEDGFLYDIAHNCDIIAGSSGAPIISQDSGEIIALNWGGIEWSSPSSVSRENRGVSSGYLKAFVDDKVEVYKSTNQPPSIVKLRPRLGVSSTDANISSTGRGKRIIKSAGCSLKDQSKK